MSERWNIPGQPEPRTFILHLDSWLPRIFGPSLNRGVTVGQHIFFARPWCTQHGLAHEYGHVLQYRARGLLGGLAWVAWCFVRYGYAKSPAEIEADTFMNSEWRSFPAIGPVPDWAKGQ